MWQNRDAVKLERAKLKHLRKLHGIYPMLNFLNLGQLPLHMTFMSLINRLAYSYDVPPAMLTEGLLWFPDLSAPDPLGILPVAGGLITLLNMLNSTAVGGNASIRKMRKYMILMPILSIPIQMTFPAAFNLYWMSSSMVQLLIVTGFRMDNFRSYLGVPNALPGTKLERQYKGIGPDVTSQQ